MTWSALPADGPRDPARKASGDLRAGAWALALAGAGSAAFVASGLHGPDLEAQLARASAAADGGWLWWSGWYGGVDIAPYSIVSGPLMSWIGVGLAGVLACVLLSLGISVLLAGGRRRTLAVAAGAATCVGNLFSGRVTYAIGMTVAVWALVLIVRRGRAHWAMAAAVASSLISPLAALGLVTLVLALPSGALTRRSRLGLIASAGAPILITMIAFPTSSTMPFSIEDLLPALGTALIVALWCDNDAVRRGLVVVVATMLLAYAVPTALGVNATRLLMLAAPVALLAGSRHRGWRVGLGLALVCAWPVANTIGDLVSGSGPSGEQAYYAPLLAHLPSTSVTGRVEVVDPATHGADVWVANRLTIARGWERQIDVADNALFYDGTLTATSYRQWLDSLAVAYVAVPHARLDYGSKSEAALVDSGLSYLQRTWSSPDWDLYRVLDPTPMVSGPATVTEVTPSATHLTIAAAGPVVLRLRYSTVFGLYDASGHKVGHLAPDQMRQTVVMAPPGSYILR